MLTKFKPEEAKALAAEAEKDFASKWHLLQQMAAMSYGEEKTEEQPAEA